MRNQNITASSPRRLVEQAISKLERNSGVADQSIYQKLLRATVLLQRAERALLTDPNQEWPLGAPLRQSKWRKNDVA